jgi:hypothetical protein
VGANKVYKIKNFCSKFTNPTCQKNHLRIPEKMFSSINWSSLPTGVSKFTPNTKQALLHYFNTCLSINLPMCETIGRNLQLQECQLYKTDVT